VGRFENDLREAIGPRYGTVAVQYVRQPEPKGLMDAFLCAARHCGNETAVLQLSDEIFLSPDFSVLRRMDEADFLCGYTLPADPAEICENYAVLCRGETFLYAIEKPRLPIGGKKGTGLCVFSGACLSVLLEAPEAQAAAWDLCGFMNALVRAGKKGLAVRVAEEEINVNDAANLAYAKRRLETEGENG
jgi:dTDP-glucose pyrophosphorylase